MIAFILLGRPTYYVGGRIYFTSVSSSLFFRRLISEVAERNSTKIGHMVGSKCNSKTHVRNLGYHLPLQIGCPKTTFWTNSQLNGNFNGIYLRQKTWYRQLVKYVDNYKGSPTSSQKCHELWSTNGFKLDLHFYPPYVNSAFHFIASLSRRRSVNGTQPNFAK